MYRSTSITVANVLKLEERRGYILGNLIAFNSQVGYSLSPCF
jgi:hypothetical protein